MNEIGSCLDSLSNLRYGVRVQGTCRHVTDATFVLRICVWMVVLTVIPGAVIIGDKSAAAALSWRRLARSNDRQIRFTHHREIELSRHENDTTQRSSESGRRGLIAVSDDNRPSSSMLLPVADSLNVDRRPNVAKLRYSRRSSTIIEDEIDDDDDDDVIGGEVDRDRQGDVFEASEQRLPQAIIIGVKKGGTRALLEFLKAHPDVRAPNPEIHFFDRHYDRGLEWYRKQMPPTTENQLTIEKTPSYFITKVAPGRIRNMSYAAGHGDDGVRLIVVVRDPVTRAVSDYTQAAVKRPDLPPFDRLAFVDRPTGDGDGEAVATKDREVNTSWGAIKIGLYARHFERWLRHFRLDRIHFVHGERLVTDPAGELGLVQDFLGLRRVITAEWFYLNSTKGFPCLRQLSPLADLNTVTSSSTSLAQSSPFVGDHSFVNRTSSLRCLGKTKGRIHPTIDEDILQRLRVFYRPFNEKFYNLTGINFGWL